METALLILPIHLLCVVLFVFLVIDAPEWPDLNEPAFWDPGTWMGDHEPRRRPD